MNSTCSVSGLTGECHKINRENVLTDVMTLYEPSPGPAFLEEFPFRVQFQGERAIDVGGVARDMFTSFWERAYIDIFDGGSLLTPAVHHQVDMKKSPP